MKGVSKKDLAKYIDSTLKTIDSYEFNRFYPSPKRLVKIAKCLDSPLEYFFDEYYEFIFNDYSLKIRNWREKSKLSPKEAARLIGINPAILDRWEKRISYPDRVNYKRLVKILETFLAK